MILGGIRPPMQPNRPMTPWGAQPPIADPRMVGQFPMQQMQAPIRPAFNPRVLGTFKHGGKVKKTGLYKLHKGEKVVPLSSLAKAK